MSKVKWLALVATVMALGLTGGCGGGDDDDDGGGGAGGGSYAGTWTGHVCGRGLVMEISQDGTMLSGTYTFSDPTFNGTFSVSRRAGSACFLPFLSKIRPFSSRNGRSTVTFWYPKSSGARILTVSASLKAR